MRDGFARLLGDSADNIALGQNTHGSSPDGVRASVSAAPPHHHDNGEFHRFAANRSSCRRGR